MLYFEARKKYFELHTYGTVCDDIWHTEGTRKAHVPVVCTYCVPDVCTYCDGARNFHNLKVWTKSYPTVVIAHSNFIPSALWLKLNSAIKIIKIFKNLEKIENVKIFKIFENFAPDVI